MPECHNIWVKHRWVKLYNSQDGHQIITFCELHTDLIIYLTVSPLGFWAKSGMDGQCRFIVLSKFRGRFVPFIVPFPLNRKPMAIYSMELILRLKVVVRFISE